MLISTSQHCEAGTRSPGERRPDKKSSYVLASFVMLCVTVAFYPLTEPADMTSNALNASRIAELALLALAAGVITLAAIVHRCPLSIRSHSAVIAFLFCLWAMMSAMWSLSPILSFARGGTLMLLLYIAVALTIYVRHISKDSVRAITIIMTGALLGSIVLLLLSNAVIWGTLLKFSEETSWSWGGRTGRLLLARSHALETGELIGLATIVAAFGFQRLGSKIVSLCLLFWLLWLTDARNLLAFVPFSLAVAWFQHGSARVRFILVSASALGVALLVILAISGHLASMLPQDLSTLNGRTPLWAIAGEYISDDPVLGVGYYATRFYLMDSHFLAGHAHNAYVEALMGTGLIGLSLLMMFLIYCTKVCISSDNALLTAIVVFSFLGGIFNPVILASNPLTFYLLVACIVFAEAAADKRAVAIVRPGGLSDPGLLRNWAVK